MTDLVELAKRVEALDGPCRETDAEIGAACRIIDGGPLDLIGEPFFRVSPCKRRVEHGSCVEGDDVVVKSREPARFTASLDAAMTLVLEGWPSVYLARTDDGRWHAALAGNDGHMMAEDPEEYYVEADAATPALALTAAAIRALAAQGEGRIAVDVTGRGR